MQCDHVLAERETACADGMCPICLGEAMAALAVEHQGCAAEVERLTKERDLALANADAVYARLMPEIERLRVRNAALVESLLDHRCLVDGRVTVVECQQCGCVDGLLTKPLNQQNGRKE